MIQVARAYVYVGGVLALVGAWPAVGVGQPPAEPPAQDESTPPPAVEEPAEGVAARTEEEADTDGAGEPSPSEPASSGSEAEASESDSSVPTDDVRVEDIQVEDESAASDEPILEEPEAIEDVSAIEELDLEALLSQPVVTASGEESVQRALAAANVIQIGREEIDTFGWRSVGEVLMQVPGLHLIDDLVTTHVGVRGVTGGIGAGSRIVKVMINGVTVSFRPNLHAFLGPEFIPMSAIERIEIAKGPLSALYGANAFLATVNIITRDREEGVHGRLRVRGTMLQSNQTVPEGAPVPDSAFSRGVEEFNEGVGGEIMLSYRRDNVSLMAAFSGGRFDRSGQRVRRTFDAQDPNLALYRAYFSGVSREDRDRPMSGYAILTYEPEDYGTLTLQGGHQRLDASADFQPTTALTHRSRMVLLNSWGDLRYRLPIGERVTLQANLGYSQGRPGEDEELFVTGSLQSTYFRQFEYKAIDAGLSARVKLTEEFGLRIRADIANEFHDLLFFRQRFNVPVGTREPGDFIDVMIGDDDLRTQEIRTFGASINASGAPIPGVPEFRLAADFRVDAPNLFDPQFSFRIALAYSWLPNFVTKLIVGRAYQVPSAELLFARGGFGNSANLLGARSVGRNVGPQTVVSAELVNTIGIAQALAIDVSLFYQSVSDLIRFEQQTNNFIASNGDTATNFGIELMANLQHSRVVGALGGTLLFTANDDGLSVDPPVQFPSYFLVARASVLIPEIYLRPALNLRWVGPRAATAANVFLNNSDAYTLDSYAQLDIVLNTMNLHLFSDDAPTTIRIGIQNVANARVPEPGYAGFDFPTLGRTLFAELTQDF